MVIETSSDFFTNWISANFGITATAAILIFSIIMIWTVIWKAIALWKSARKNHLAWFIIFLIINTVGILEILYIYVFSKMNMKGKPKTFPKRKRR